MAVVGELSGEEREEVHAEERGGTPRHDTLVPVTHSDGRVLCTSIPSYGQGKEAGNESGYLVGMSTCYPEPGSARIKDGELVTVVSNYSNSQQHTGVMGSFYILVAELQEKQDVMSRHSIPFAWGEELPKHSWVFLLMAGLAAVIVGLFYRSRGHEDEGYQTLVIA